MTKIYEEMLEQLEAILNPAYASGIVVPLFKEGNVIGVLDIDSPVKGRLQKRIRKVWKRSDA